MSLVQNEGYSATVDIRLLVDGVNFDVAQVGENTLFLAKPNPTLPLASARLVVTVDGEEFNYDIVLCNVDGVCVSYF